MRNDSIQQDFRRLEDQPDRHGRGPMFERLMRRVFERAGFSVIRNPGTVHPRQTDLLASYKGEDYLVETKWQKADIDVGDVSALRDRLDRIASHVVGVFISMSPYGEGAVREVGVRRDRPILLVTSDEVRELVGGGVGLRTLLRRKRDHLLQRGRVLLDATGDAWRHRQRPDRSALPKPDVELRDLGGSQLPWVSGRGSLVDLVYAQDLPDVDWRPAQGRGVGFDLAPPIERRRDVAYALEALRSVGWVTSAGRWSIHQTETSWFGVGAQSFLEALDAWQPRYKEVGGRTQALST